MQTLGNIEWIDFFKIKLNIPTNYFRFDFARLSKLLYALTNASIQYIHNIIDIYMYIHSSVRVPGPTLLYCTEISVLFEIGALSEQFACLV